MEKESDNITQKHTASFFFSTRVQYAWLAIQKHWGNKR